MFDYINATIEKLKQTYAAATKRLEPLVKAAKLAYGELLKSAKATLKAAKSGVNLAKSAINVATSLVKAVGNTGKAMGYDLPAAAYSHYHVVPEQTARSLQDVANDFSAAGTHLCQAANDAAETASLSLDFVNDSAAACAQTINAAYHVGGFVSETGKVAYEGTQVVSECLYNAGSVVYSYTPSYETVKSLALPLYQRVIGPNILAEAPAAIEQMNSSVSAPAA